MFKKIISPIIYTAFIPVTFVGVVGIINVIVPIFVSSLKSTFIFVMPPVIIIFGTFLYWTANKLIAKLEKPYTPKIADHFRQSGLPYLIFFSILSGTLQAWYGGFHHPRFIYFTAIALLVSILAIFINAIFLYKHRQANPPTNI